MASVCDLSPTSTQPKSIPPKHEQMTGADVVVWALIHQGVEVVFAYPGGASMPLHQSLTRFRDRIRTVLPRQEQGGAFAAQGYARSTGRPGVCMATSGPGATNLVTALADAKLDSIPIVAITGQVPTAVIGSDAFQETPIVEVCRTITKHHYLVTDANDLARVVREAFFVATTGRPGPVLIDLPKNVQLARITPDFDVPMDLPGYCGEAREPSPGDIEAMAAAIREAHRPVIYAGGGIIAAEASEELRRLVQITGIPVTMTLMGLGAFPGDHPLSLDMLGMHGSVYANYAVHECDLLLALGVRFDDRVTGKVSAFAPQARIVHVDVDPSELHKNKPAHLAIAADVKRVLQALNAIVEPPAADLGPWIARINGWKRSDPLDYDHKAPQILPQHAIRELWRLTKDRHTIIATGVGQHQMWAAQFYKFSRPRTWLTSGGLGTMGFGLPAALGAKIAHPDALVIDIDGDGSLLMNLQEMAACYCEKAPVKVLLLNNQHLGMVVQWEDRFFNANRAHTYLGPIDRPEAIGQAEGQASGPPYPDFVQIARGFGWQARHVADKAELVDALQEMIDSPECFLLDVAVPYQEHVLPMIPSGMTVHDLIKE